MKKTLIKNAFVVNEGETKQMDVLIEAGKIAQIKEEIAADDQTELVEAKGKYLLPGLIDDQVHFREPGLTHKACIRTESRAAVAGGITSFIEMPNTNPQTTTREELDRKFAIADRDALANYSFMFGGTNDNFEEIKKFRYYSSSWFKVILGVFYWKYVSGQRRGVAQNIFFNRFSHFGSLRRRAYHSKEFSRSY